MNKYQNKSLEIETNETEKRICIKQQNNEINLDIDEIIGLFFILENIIQGFNKKQ